MGKQLTTEQFIEKACNVHGDRYVYDDKTIYNGHRENVTIYCPQCNSYFTQKANNHLNGHGCPRCNTNMGEYNTETFKEACRFVHGDKYDDSEIIYKGKANKVKVICHKKDEDTGLEHGPFWIQARRYLGGCGCAKCIGKYWIKQLPDKEKEDGRKNREFETMSFDRFVEKAKKKHGETFIYKNTDYESYYRPMKITCLVGHEFTKIPYKHVAGEGCPYCKNGLPKTFEDFKEENFKVHGEEDLSYVNFVNYSTQTTFVCHKKDKITGKEHGKYIQTPRNHLMGFGCPKCSGKYRPTMEELIEKFNIIHNNEYTYVDKEYLGHAMRIHAICKEHGEFDIGLKEHLDGKGCPYCGKSFIPKYTFDKFKRMAELVHGKKYIYLEENFNIPDSPQKCGIICNKHGLFIQNKVAHISGSGCPHCSGNARLTNEQFKERVMEIYGDLYDLSDISYKNAKTDVILYCKIHGMFKKDPYSLLRGSGCPHCSQSKLEKSVDNFLSKNRINFIREKKYVDLGQYRYDFYLGDINLLIECQGQQHFEFVEHFDKYDSFENRLRRDLIKYNYAKDNNIKLFYLLPQQEVDYLNGIFENMYSDDNTAFKTLEKLEKAIQKELNKKNIIN